MQLRQPVLPGSSPLARGLRMYWRSLIVNHRIIPARAGFTCGWPCFGGVLGDHPRSRGVYQFHAGHVSDPLGSSPLARGLLTRRGGGSMGRRIIPARAGFTDTAAKKADANADHPRSRGVYRRRTRGTGRTGGSSPLARGLLVEADLLQDERRIIPARAGFTSVSALPADTVWDHPRSRGVYQFHAGHVSDPLGSSPLARGLRRRSSPMPCRVRIIPARAGFTTSWGGRTGFPTDHPRSRGVYLSIRRRSRGRRGSSPLARGLRLVKLVPDHNNGIIPARAGFTWIAIIVTSYSWDHPRSRGVYSAPKPRPSGPTGSSPLARGLLPRQVVGHERSGIIPARAGFTSARRLFAASAADHPRSRGVYGNLRGADGGAVGSSPLARGLPLSRTRLRSLCGIIPARAGFTFVAEPMECCISDHPRSRGVYSPRLRGTRATAGSSPLARGLPG